MTHRCLACPVVIISILLCVFFLTGSAAAPPQRIVAVGDIHGDLDSFVGILQRAHLVDPSRRWSGAIEPP